MPKRKRGAFNPTQIKNGYIVRLSKDGRIKAVLDPYYPKHPKKEDKS
jgi:hypothetical protein